MRSMMPNRALVIGLLAGLSLAACNRGARAPGARRGPIENRAHDPEATVELARRFHEQGLDELALAELEKIIAVNPQLTTAYLGVGDIYRTRGDYTTAETQYRRAADIEPRNFDAQYFHGLTLQVLNRIAEAVAAYLRALAIRPDDFDANLNVATAYLQLGEPRQAMVYAQRAVGLRGTSGAARANLGSIYSAMGDHDAAVVEYQQAAELMELTPELLLNLADSLGRIGRYAEMQSTLEELIKVRPSAIAHERLGAARFRGRQYAGALESFRAALELDPDHYPALNGVGVCRLNEYILGGKSDRAAVEEALRCFRRSLQINPDQPAIKDHLTRYR